MSGPAFLLIQPDADFAFEFRGKIDTKGKGVMDMWFVTGSERMDKSSL